MQVFRRPAQLQMDDASKLYIANAGPILGNGFEVGLLGLLALPAGWVGGLSFLHKKVGDGNGGGGGGS
jgi:hypothetical protein